MHRSCRGKPARLRMTFSMILDLQRQVPDLHPNLANKPFTRCKALARSQAAPMAPGWKVRAVGIPGQRISWQDALLVLNQTRKCEYIKVTISACINAVRARMMVCRTDGCARGHVSLWKLSNDSRASDRGAAQVLVQVYRQKTLPKQVSSSHSSSE